LAPHSFRCNFTPNNINNNFRSLNSTNKINNFNNVNSFKSLPHSSLPSSFSFSITPFKFTPFISVRGCIHINGPNPLRIEEDREKAYRTEACNWDLFILARDGDSKAAHVKFQEMKDAGHINRESFEIILEAHDNESWDAPRTLQILEEMKKLKYMVSHKCYEYVIAAHACSPAPEDVQKVKPLIEEMKTAGFPVTDKTRWAIGDKTTDFKQYKISKDPKDPSMLLYCGDELTEKEQQTIAASTGAAMDYVSEKFAAQLKLPATTTVNGKEYILVGELPGITEKDIKKQYKTDEEARNACTSKLYQTVGESFDSYQLEVTKNLLWNTLNAPGDFKEIIYSMLGANVTDTVRPKDIKELAENLAALGEPFRTFIAKNFTTPGVTPKFIMKEDDAD